MSTVMRLSRYGKIVALTAVGGSFYLLRDHIKPFLIKTPPVPQQHRPQEPQLLKKIERLPEQVPYLLVGGGTATHSAMRAIRGHDPKAKVLIISGENHSPYMRPALSKELWFSDRGMRRDLSFKWWNGKDRSIYYEIDEFFIPVGNLIERETGGVSLIKNIRMTRLDPDNRVAYLENGQQIKYDKCLLAPGLRPKSLPQLSEASKEVKDRIVYFKTADDFLRLEEIARTAKSIVVIGGGFLGSELTCALASQKADKNAPQDQIIYQTYPESGNLGKILPQYLSEWISKKVEAEGASLIPNVEVVEAKMNEKNSIDLKLSNGQTIQVDCIVSAVGSEPDVELAQSSELEVDEKTGGYLVNAELEARTNVWVAGDASCFYDTKLGRRRVEHHDHAVNSGRLAGQNMVGSSKAYTHQSMFWSDLGVDMSFEAVGIIDSSLPTVAVFAQPEELVNQRETSDNHATVDERESQGAKSAPTKPQIDEPDKYSKGVVFYLKNDVIVGILLWNLFSRLTIARRILNEQKRYDDFNEVAKLFNIYLDD